MPTKPRRTRSFSMPLDLAEWLDSFAKRRDVTTNFALVHLIRDARVRDERARASGRELIAEVRDIPPATPIAGYSQRDTGGGR
jgi:hypothetical protein